MAAPHGNNSPRHTTLGKRIVNWSIGSGSIVLAVICVSLYFAVVRPAGLQSRFAQVCTVGTVVAVTFGNRDFCRTRTYRLNVEDTKSFLEIMRAGTSPDNHLYMNVLDKLRVVVLDADGNCIADVIVTPGRREPGKCVYNGFIPVMRTCLYAVRKVSSERIRSRGSRRLVGLRF
jgi:hypothetical protein